MHWQGSRSRQHLHSTCWVVPEQQQKVGAGGQPGQHAGRRKHGCARCSQLCASQKLEQGVHSLQMVSDPGSRAVWALQEGAPGCGAASKHLQPAAPAAANHDGRRCLRQRLADRRLQLQVQCKDGGRADHRDGRDHLRYGSLLAGCDTRLQRGVERHDGPRSCDDLPAVGVDAAAAGEAARPAAEQAGLQACALAKRAHLLRACLVAALQGCSQFS